MVLLAGLSKQASKQASNRVVEQSSKRSSRTRKPKSDRCGSKEGRADIPTSQLNYPYASTLRRAGQRTYG